MNRRRMMSRAGATPVLPTEYQKVEWVGNNTDAFIALPVMNIAQNSVVKCRFRKSSAASTEEALFMAQCDGRTTIEIGFSSNNKLFAYSPDGTSSAITDSSIYGAWVDYTAVYQSTAPTKKTTAIVNGTTINGTDGTGTNNHGLSQCALFRNPSAMALSCKAQLASFTLMLEGTVALNLIPCYRKADSMIGMYNTVSQTFLVGTGTLTKGADV